MMLNQIRYLYGPITGPQYQPSAVDRLIHIKTVRRMSTGRCSDEINGVPIDFVAKMFWLLVQVSGRLLENLECGL